MTAESKQTVHVNPTSNGFKWNTDIHVLFSSPLVKSSFMIAIANCISVITEKKMT